MQYSGAPFLPESNGFGTRIFLDCDKFLEALQELAYLKEFVWIDSVLVEEEMRDYDATRKILSSLANNCTKLKAICISSTHPTWFEAVSDGHLGWNIMCLLRNNRLFLITLELTACRVKDEAVIAISDTLRIHEGCLLQDITLALSYHAAYHMMQHLGDYCLLQKLRLHTKENHRIPPSEQRLLEEVAGQLRFNDSLEVFGIQYD